MKFVINKTHAKNASGLYKRGEVYEAKDIEGLQYKIEEGYIAAITDDPIEVYQTKEEKKTRKRR